MGEQQTLFGLAAKVFRSPVEEAERAKAKGIEQALSAVDPKWQRAFERAVESLAKSGIRFTSDEVIAKCGLARVSKANRNNSVGGMMNRCRRLGMIEPTGRFVRSKRIESHRRMVAEWRGAEDA